MDEIADITDENSLRAWLLAQEDAQGADAARRIAVTVAARAAARVLPVYWDWVLTSKSARNRDLTVLPVLRSTMISAVAGTCPTADVKSAADASAASATTADAASAASAADAAYAAAAFAASADAASAAASAVSAALSARHAVSARDAVSAARAAVRADLRTLQRGESAFALPLWPDANPLADYWSVVQDQLRGQDDWRFCLCWYAGLLDGTAPPPDHPMLVDIALLDKDNAFKLWNDPPQALSAINAVFEQYGGEGFDPSLRYVGDATDPVETAPEPSTEKTSIAAATYFDFVEFNRLLRAVGFPNDVSPFDDPDTKADFLRDIEDLIHDLQDWCDYAQGQPGTNQISPLRRAVQKLLEQLEDLSQGEPVSLRRLVSVGSDVRRFSTDAQYRAELGDGLSEMLDERVDHFSTVARKHFGPVFAKLAPLQELELGMHDPSALIDGIRAALGRMDAVSGNELPKLDAATRAILEDMLLELEELDAAIEGETKERRLALLRQRFAEKYGGFSATYGRYVEKGTEIAQANGKRFDDAVKWYRRWETVEKILDWWRNLPGGDVPPGI